MPTAQVAKHSCAILPGRAVFAEEHELAQKRVAVVLAPNVVQLHLVDEFPFWVMRQGPLHAIWWWQLPLVAGQDEAGHPTGRQPHLVQALEVLLDQLEGFVDHYQMVPRHERQRLRQRSVEQESAMARI